MSGNPERRKPYALPTSTPTTPIRTGFEGNPFAKSQPPSPVTFRPVRQNQRWNWLLRLTNRQILQISALAVTFGIGMILYGLSQEMIPQGVREVLSIPLGRQSEPDLGWKPAQDGKPRAALISLVRESELKDLLQSISDMESRFNNVTDHRYPWIFFSESEFSENFENVVSSSVSGEAVFAQIPTEHWSIPKHIDMELFMNSLEIDGQLGVGKAYIESYRHMCRWNSGFFFEHPVLKDYDYYWRVEPDVRFFCDIDYDVFKAMRDNEWKYGFNMNILDDARSFPALWKQVRKMLSEDETLLHPEADLRWLMDLRIGGGARKEGHGAGMPGKPTEAEKKRNWMWGEYNGCQYFSNFEIGDLNFFRSPAYKRFFSYLDTAGGFFYERWGDAPVHTLALSVLLPKSAIHYFHDIGYTHGINTHCPLPANRSYLDDSRFSLHDQVILNKLLKGKNCSCQQTNLDEGFYKLVPMESPQTKPEMSCLRRWLGLENAEDLAVEEEVVDKGKKIGDIDITGFDDKKEEKVASNSEVFDELAGREWLVVERFEQTPAVVKNPFDSFGVMGAKEDNMNQQPASELPQGQEHAALTIGELLQHPAGSMLAPQPTEKILASTTSVMTGETSIMNPTLNAILESTSDCKEKLYTSTTATVSWMNMTNIKTDNI